MVLPHNDSVCLNSSKIPATPTVYNPDKKILLLAFGIVDIVYTVACALIFIFMRRTRRYEHLRLRPVSLVVLLVLMNVRFAPSAVGLNRPCSLPKAILHLQPAH